MNISTKYNPQETEDKWYQHWLNQNFFHSEPDEREPYTIVIPPPNVTGVLHMGHMLNNTIQDVLIRRARMMGKNACWVPGTDHASIATEAKVVALLKEKGIAKTDLTRQEFLNHAYEWKEKYGGIILEQLKKLGASCDWKRTRFTMEPSLSEAVIDVFIELHRRGLIYRGVRMVNWDPQGKTAVSDEEVIRKEVNQKLYYINYPVVGENSFVTIATTRPETIMADTAVCINPNDNRYTHLKGKKVKIPLLGREISIIEDDYVTMDFGTGCLKVTPAHDLNDYELGIKHHLEVIDILNDDGTLNEKAQLFIGEDRFIARKKIAKQLEEAGFLLKVEDNKSQIGFSERTDAVIEPKLSMQWFCKMDAMAKPALEAVSNGDIKLIPEKYINTYKYWMENVRDWCISRQLWWGQQIPAWYAPNGAVKVAKTAEEALALFHQDANFTHLTLSDLRQDEDVVDTWFSSWLWPISVFDGFKDPENKDFNYYYPTNDLVTAPEILFFWVARMIMAGTTFKNQIPFKNVYLTGIVRDKIGRKMSKSLGNSPDPIALIEKYGADGVRVGMLLCSPAGNDLMFDESYCEQGRNFANKIWNAFRLVKGLQVDPHLPNPNQQAIQWFDSNFNQTLVQIEADFANYRLSDALMNCYKLVWDDFCSWYLEMVKPVFGCPIDAQSFEATKSFFNKILRLLHPFMPFLTEEIWHDELFGNRTEKDCCIVATYPTSENFDIKMLKEAQIIQSVITEIRNIRNIKQISPKIALPLSIKSNGSIIYENWYGVIQKLANIDAITLVNEKITSAQTFIAETDEFFVNLGSENLNIEEEKTRIEEELKYLHGFLKSVEAKLSNERFVQNAKPEIVENERKKQQDSLSKIQILNEQLKSL